MAFSDNAILEGATPWERSLEGQTQATIPGKTQPVPTEEPAKELAPSKVPTEEVASTEEPTEEAAPTEEPTEEPTTLMATISKPAEEPDIPPCVV